MRVVVLEAEPAAGLEDEGRPRDHCGDQIEPIVTGENSLGRIRRDFG
jgi:hypothetical protein